MTNFEKKMLEVAQEVLKDKEVDLQMILCNAGNLPCSQCPINDKCIPNHGEANLDEWLRQEVSE